MNGSNRNVIEITLNDTDSGATTKLFAPIDHIAAADGSALESLQIDATVRFSDADGDSVTGIIRTTVHDDSPTLTQTYRYNDVHESGIGGVTGTDASNFAVSYGADGYGATTFTGALKLNIGGGLAGNVTLDLSSGPAGSAKLTSDGHLITFELADGNTIRGFITVNGSNRNVIEITLNDTDSGATTKLFAPIDHIAAADGSALESLQIDATVRFSDADGDSVTGIIRTTVHDDTPVSAGLAAVGSLSENGLPQVASDFADLNVSVGADKNGTHVQIGTSNGLPIINTNLTSDGVALEYIVRTTNGVDQELVAFKAGSSADDPVFIVAVLRPGSFATTLFQNIDHLGASDDVLALNLVARVFDGDGDYVDQPFTINILDSQPTAIDLTAAMGENEGLDVTLAEGTSFSFGADSTGGSVAIGTVTLSYGPLGVSFGTPTVTFDSNTNKISIAPCTAFDESP